MSDIISIISFSSLTTDDRLHVACTGDSRGVMGTYVEAGKWRVDALSQDQTGKNLVEVQRCAFLFSPRLLCSSSDHHT